MSPEIKVVIVDDEPDAIEIIQLLCAQHELSLSVCDTCTKIDEAIESIKTHKPQILFLDIKFSNGLGFDVLKAFPQPSFHTVFVSAFDQYAMSVIKHHAFDYLLKPLDQSEFNSTVSQLATHLDKSPPHQIDELEELAEVRKSPKIGLPTAIGTDYYDLNEIMHLKADGSYTHIKLVSGKQVTVCKRLKIFDKALPSGTFLRVHRTHMVNLNYIGGIKRNDGRFLVLTNGDEVPIARSEQDRKSVV